MADLFLTDSLTAEKKKFQTLSGSNKVTMYCCGVTPYSHTHIGHARTFFSYDILFRTLRDLSYDINWARNITDIDDKIIQKAQEEKTTCKDIVSKFVGEQEQMLQRFSLERPQHEPKVTESIGDIISLIQTLESSDFAYTSATGVYFRVRKFSEYGKLSKNKLDDLRSGVRISIDDSKEDNLDFALWKFAKPGEESWPSPWGEGRPGWHVECSAMIHRIFGNSIDIHMGGRDLIFPHHECEIAQSEAATGQTFAHFWLHTGMVTLNGQKMSKSSGHFVTLTNFLSSYPADVLRLLFLSASYSSSLDFSEELIQENLKKLCKIYRFIEVVQSYVTPSDAPFISTEKPPSQNLTDLIFGDLIHLKDLMRAKIRDDLNTGAALALFFDFMKSINAKLIQNEKKGLNLSTEDKKILSVHWRDFIQWFNTALGLLSQPPHDFFAELSEKFLPESLKSDQVQELLDQRDAARKTQDWKEADRIRKLLLSQGICIQDTPRGTRWFVDL